MIIATKKKVPNEFPRLKNQSYRIAFVGEAPGGDEEYEGRPFVGFSGRLLWAECAKVGILRDACYVGNICQIRPPGNKIEEFSFNGPEITSGLEILWKELDEFKPNLCVLLGASPLKAFLGEPQSITSWRGSLFQAKGYKCLATIHPAFVLRQYDTKVDLRMDLKRASIEGKTPTLELPTRDLQIHLSLEEILLRLSIIKHGRPTISIDIEGYVDHMTCISIATSPWESFIIPFGGWQHHEEVAIIRALAVVLSDAAIPKILQNSLYDTFVLQYGYNIPVRGVVDDTMLAHWELLCEKKKSLAYQASIYTREPYWKEERDDDNQDTRWRYCCKDSAVTYEIRDVLHQHLKGPSLDHYRFNLKLLEPLLYMEMKGIRYDHEKAKKKLSEIETTIYRLQWALDSIAGIVRPDNVSGWVDVCRDTFCFKRSSVAVNLVQDIVPHSKLTSLHLAQRATEVLRGDLSKAACGELSILTDLALNVESPPRIADFLYRQLYLPIQFKKEKGRKTDKETTDVVALLTLYGKTEDPTLKLILTIRALRTRSVDLRARYDWDGHIRCGYNLVGTKTGRLSCYESPTGSGFNLQTVTKKDRDLFVAEPGYYFFQCDLSGADGWTVAAHCAACGDSTMLDDYNGGIKPARVIALLKQYGHGVLKWSREELKSRGRDIDPEGWLYFACKRVQHGSNYGMKENTMSDQILKDSYKLYGEPIFVEPATCGFLQHLYFLRYPGILSWHRKIKSTLKQHGRITSASGHTRIFFGRREDHQTFTDACAEEPQNVTTHVCNLALYRCWSDPENRLETDDHGENEQQGVGFIPYLDWNGDAARMGLRASEEVQKEAALRDAPKLRVRLRCQPLHVVHDALCGQFRREDVGWATPKIHEWFNNPITIAGQTLTIPFEGAYGESWGSLKVGSI